MTRVPQRRGSLVRSLAMRAGLSGVVGAATTLAVAWTVALIGFRTANSRHTALGAIVIRDGFTALLVTETQRGWGKKAYWMHTKFVAALTPTTVETEPRCGLSPNDQHPRLPRLPSHLHLQDELSYPRDEFQFGWPLPAMWAAKSTGNLEPQGRFDHIGNLWGGQSACSAPIFYHDNISLIPTPGTVPTGILPRGFALNTGFYAGSWLLLLSLPAALRHTLRRRRAQCESCGYPHTGLTPAAACPECGASQRAPPSR